MRRLRAQDGFTVIEVLSAMTVGLVVLAATFGLLESTLRLNAGVMAKTDAMQRGRLAMDVMTQQIRSQVCLDSETPAVVAGQDTWVTFYADHGAAEGQAAPAKRTLVFDPARGSIGNYFHTTTAWPAEADDYPVTPTGTNLVLENAVLQPGVPFLRYYAYTEVDGRPQPDLLLPTPLSGDDAARVARIEIAYVARPTGARDDEGAVNLNDQIVARHADPNAIPDPTDPDWPRRRTASSMSRSSAAARSTRRAGSSTTTARAARCWRSAAPTGGR
jgi:prepilin-type N-terminal cleavage/methylation domain-containing protein